MNTFKYIIHKALFVALPLLGGVGGGLLTACQDKDIDVMEPVLSAPDESSITGSLQGDDYVWTWGDLGGCDMQVTLVVGGTKSGTEICKNGTYTHRTVDTGIQYKYIFKRTDGSNLSKGVIKEYMRRGAQKITGLSMRQVEKANGYDALVEWDKAADATKIHFTATNGSRTVSEDLAGDATSYTITDVLVGEAWSVTVVADNAEGTSLSVANSLRIGKTAVGFLSLYATPDELIEKGDDDEACAWLWFNSEYPTGKYIYFGDIASSADLEPYRVLFWLRDLEEGGEYELFNLPEAADNAVPSIREWYKNGGSLLLWQHAVTFITNLGRIPQEAITNNDRAIGIGRGGYNGDTWKMAVQLHPGSRFKVDMSSHPIYKGIEYEENDRTKLIPMKGAGWTEDHNCLFFNYPSQLTGLGNQDQACYDQVTKKFGIYPLATWDSQIDWVSQLNIWEAQQGDTEFQGTVICVGNGGCEFSLKNADGTPDISAYPKNNPFQDNVLRMAKNAIEYLKTR